MIFVRSHRWLKWGLATAGLLAVTNHAEAWRRAHAAPAGDGVAPSVRSEAGVSGHNSIGIDESSLNGPGSERFLHFSTLGQWEYKRDAPTRCPAPIQGLSGQRFSSVGFMYPLEAGERVKSFCLLRSTQTCCYGPRPQYNQYLLVESKAPVSFERLAPVLVHGAFFVEPKPDDGYIYRMEADSVRAVEADTPEVDPVVAAGRARLPLFDYAPLASMAGKKGGPIPSALDGEDGKTVVLSGYCVERTRDRPPRLILGKSWWDGVAQGTPPTVFNSAVVLPADAQEVPPLWKPHQVFTGIVRVIRDPRSWAREGVVHLQDAQLGVPGVTPGSGFRRAGPVLPWPFEALAFLLVLCGALGWRRAPAGRT